MHGLSLKLNFKEFPPIEAVVYVSFSISPYIFSSEEGKLQN